MAFAIRCVHPGQRVPPAGNLAEPGETPPGGFVPGPENGFFGAASPAPFGAESGQQIRRFAGPNLNPI